MELNFNKRFASAHYHDFEDVSEIYRSNSGAVHKARFKFDKKWYVLKERNMAELGNIKSNRRAVMMHEVNMLQQLAHPNVIKCEGWFWDHSRRRDMKGKDDQGSLFIVLEYLDGGDLHKKIEFHRSKKCYFSERYVWYIFHQICSAVCHLHENGIVHRDLKTLNIILTKNDTVVKVADLGVSRQVSEDTVMLKTFYGTPLYLSPELVDNAQYNEKTDIWSLGIILYELAALHPPFRANTLIGLANAIRKGEYEPIDDMYSKSLQRCIQWLLQLDQKKRPSIRQVVYEVSKHLSPGYYGIEDWNTRPVLENALSQAVSQLKEGNHHGDSDDDTDIEEDDEEGVMVSGSRNLASPRIISSGGLVGNIARLIGEQKGAALENEKDFRLEKEWTEQKKENVVPNPSKVSKESKKTSVEAPSRPSTVPANVTTEKMKIKSLPMPIPLQSKNDLPEDAKNLRPVTAIDGHIRDTARLRQTRERLRKEREEMREKERIAREKEKKAKRDKQILIYEELKAQEKEKKERREIERAVEVKIAQEIKPLVEEKKNRGDGKVEALSARYNKDRERDYAKIAVNPPHPEVIVTGNVGKKQDDFFCSNTDVYADAVRLDKSDKSKPARKERLQYNGSGKHYFAREHRKYVDSSIDGKDEGSARGLLQKETGIQNGTSTGTYEGSVKVDTEQKAEQQQDDVMIKVDAYRVYTILRREMLRLKRLEQLLQLSGNGGKSNEDLLEKLSEVKIIISQITQAKQTGYLKRSIALKLGLQTDGKNQSSGDTAMAEPVAISQFDNSKMSHIPQDHVVVGDGWVPPAEKNVIELEFNHKLPPKISNDPFRHQIQLHSLFTHHNDKAPGSSPLRPTTASATGKYNHGAGSTSSIEISFGERSSRDKHESLPGKARRPTTAAPSIRDQGRNVPERSMKAGRRKTGANFNIISGAYM